MTFEELVQVLEQRLGYHQLPRNPAARDFRDIFETAPVHGDFMLRVLKQIYKHNGCRRFSDPVCPLKTNEALAPLRTELMRAANTDVETFHLMEELGQIVNQVLVPEPGPAGGPEAAEPRGKIIPLAPHRHRRYLKTSF